MVTEFKALLMPDEKKGLKSRCTYIVVPENIIRVLNHWEKKKPFYVKGHIEYYKYTMLQITPAGDGNFILRLNSIARKAVNKVAGETVRVRIQKDRRFYRMPLDFYQCLMEEGMPSRTFFLLLPPLQQHYFYKWITDSKTDEVRVQRIARTLEAIKRKEKFAQMRRSVKPE